MPVTKKMLCPGESKKKKKTNTIMDLNELPPDFDYDFLDESEANPSYCTQIVPCGGAKTVHDTEHAAVSNNEGPNGDGIGAIGNNIAEDAPTMDVSNDEGPNGDDIGAVGNNITEDATTMVDNTQDVAVAEDIWSTLPVPYTGQTFGTKQEARAFYNSYARRIGFSVRTSTSRLSGPAREQKKVLFVCNKGMVERGKRKYRLLNLMIPIMRLENLKLRITMRERAMQTLIKRSSWMVGGKERGKNVAYRL